MANIEGDDVERLLPESTTAEDGPRLPEEDIKQRQNNFARMCMLINRAGRF